MPDADRAQAHVEISKADPEETEPCPEHVALVETSHTCVSAIAGRRFGKLVQEPAGQVSERMTTKCITAEQNEVDCENDCSDADSESVPKPERFPDVVRKDHQKKECQIKKVSMHILHDQRKRTLAPVIFAWLANRARRRISPEGFIVRPPIVITRKPKSARGPKNEQSRRKDHPNWPPVGFRPEPTVRRPPKNLWRIQWRNVIAEKIILPLESGPRGIDDKYR